MLSSAKNVQIYTCYFRKIASSICKTKETTKYYIVITWNLIYKGRFKMPGPKLVFV